MQADTSTKIGEVTTELSGTKSEADATKADLFEVTKTKLQSTVGDLGVQSGLIARNHDEVEELKQPRRARHLQIESHQIRCRPRHRGSDSGRN